MRKTMAGTTSAIIFGMFFVATSFGYSTMVDQHFAMEPQDQIAIIGARITLPCRVVNKQGVLQWTKDDFGLGTRRKLSGFERYSMIGSDDEGDYSLQIYPITIEDDARFQCQVSPGDYGQPGVRSRYASVTVLVPPSPPKISQGEVLETTEDREIELECISENGKPAAEITWINGFGNLITNNVEYTEELSSDTKTITSKSIVRLSPSKDLNNKSIICQAQNTAEKSYRTAQILLVIQYAPKVVLSITEGALDTGRIPEGNIIEFLCTADAHPNNVTYSWSLNDQILTDQFTDTFILFNATRDFQHTMVKCVCQNEIGISSDTETLDIIYQPSFVRWPENVEADEQQEVTLSCEVTSNPIPDIVWVFDPIDRINLQPSVVGTTGNLKVIASTETAGRYFCKVNSPGFSEISAKAEIKLKGPPKIIAPSEPFMLTNDDLSIGMVCSAISIPKATHVSWAFNGTLIDLSADPNFSVEEITIPDGIKSILTIHSSYAEYFGKYSCIVINSFGSDTLDIVYSETKNLYSPVMMAAVSTLALIVIALLIITMRLMCLRPKQKILPPADLIPKDSVVTIKRNANKMNSFKVAEPNDHLECNSGSYSTTTTISINKSDLIPDIREHIPLPDPARCSSFLVDNLSVHTNPDLCINSLVTCVDQEVSYVNYARDYYSPTLQNANNSLLQMHREAAAYV